MPSQPTIFHIPKDATSFADEARIVFPGARADAPSFLNGQS